MVKNLVTVISLGCCLILTGCLASSSAKDVEHFVVTAKKIKIDSIPAIKVLSEIKIVRNQVYLTYETGGEYGQCHVIRYNYNEQAETLHFEKELFKKENGYYQMFIPSLFQDNQDSLYVFDKTIPSVCSVTPEGLAMPIGKHLITTSSKVPYAIVQEARQAFYKSPDAYYFIGREPKDGKQALFLSRNSEDSIRIEEVHRFVLDNTHSSWMVSFGKAACQPKRQIIAYAYHLFPAMQFIDLNSRKCRTLCLEKTNPTVLKTDVADIWEQNTVYYHDITSSNKFIYALYWGKTNEDMHHNKSNGTATSLIIKYNWNGDMVATYTFNGCLYRIGVSSEDAHLIGYDGTSLCVIQR